ncbi:hypothetical protein BDR03DRAFT_826730, partial [Suillus americanus]
CKNPACNGLPQSLMHDREHCMQPGGGMEGKAPWGQQRSEQGSKKKDLAATMTEAKSTTVANTPTSFSTSETTALVLVPTHTCDWSCTLIQELDPSCMPSNKDMACIASQTLSTILDSGTTSTLITRREFFWTFNASANITVKTTNHGTLPTSGRGDCVADL